MSTEPCPFCGWDGARPASRELEPRCRCCNPLLHKDTWLWVQVAQHRVQKARPSWEQWRRDYAVRRVRERGDGLDQGPLAVPAASLRG